MKEWKSICKICEGETFEIFEDEGGASPSDRVNYEVVCTNCGFRTNLVDTGIVTVEKVEDES